MRGAASAPAARTGYRERATRSLRLSSSLLRCPHCAAALTLTDLYSARFLRPRTCAACGGRYIEGGSTESLALIAAAAGVGSAMRQHEHGPVWLLPALVVGAAIAGTLYSHRCAPLPAEAVRRQMLQGLVAVPLVFTALSLPLRLLG